MDLDTKQGYELAVTDKFLLFAIASMHIFGSFIYIIPLPKTTHNYIHFI